MKRVGKRGISTAVPVWKKINGSAQAKQRAGCKTTTDREHKNGNRRKHCIEAVYNLTQKGTMHVDLFNPANEDWQSGKFCYWLLTFLQPVLDLKVYRIGAGGLNISRYLRTSEE